MKLARALICITILSSLFACAAPAPRASGQTRNAQPPGGRVIAANQMPGADASAKINAADAALGGSPGTIVWRGDGTLSTSAVISANHTLRLVSGHLTATADAAVIRLKDYASLVCDNWDSSISESTGKHATSSPLTIVGDYNGTQENGRPSRNITVRGCHLKGMTPVRGRVNFTAGATTITSSSPIFTRAMDGPYAPWTIYAPGVTFGGSPKTVIVAYVSPTRATLAVPAQQTTTAAATIVHFNSAPQAISLGNCRDCVVAGNWLENTHTIGIQIGGGSMFGNYAQNCVVRDNLLTGVASQNIAITNADGGQILNNTIRNFGQLNGPGAVAIDIEPNTGDRLTNVRVAGNLIDATGQILREALAGIAVQNTVGASPYGPVEVTNNRILGAPFSQAVANGIQTYGLLIRTAARVRLADNYVQRVAIGLQLDYGASNNIVERNTFASCGSGGTYAAEIADATGNRIVRNRFYDVPGSVVPGLPALARRVVETGTSDNNVFEENEADVTKVGPRSRVVGRRE